MLTLLAGAAAVAIQQAPGTANSIQPRIVVFGYAEAETTPDVATISFRASGEGKSADEAVSRLVTKSAAIQSALRSLDPTIDLHSDTVQVETVRGNECEGNDRYRERPVVSTGPCAIQGYVATQTFTGSTVRVSQAGTMVGYAARRGASGPRIDEFDVRDNRQAKAQAISAALDDARNKARAIAAGSGSVLGEIVTVTLDGASDDEIVVTGSRIQPAGERDEPIAVSLTPKPVTTSARVTVTYALRR